MSNLEKRLDKVETKIDSLIDVLKKESETRQNNASIIDNNFQILNEKIDRLNTKTNAIASVLETKIDTLTKNTDKNLKDLFKGVKGVEFELVKIQKTTQYQELYNNLKVIK